MECKKCKAALPEGTTLCPECGTDNTPAQGIVLTPGKLVGIIAAVIVVTALVVALIMNGMGYSFNKPVETQPSEQTNPPSVAPEASAQPTVQPTIPANGNPEDATCKGSYTVSDGQILQDMDKVVATVGDAQLTNGELQIYYWLQVQNFLGNYGSYAAYFGLDISQPLDTQVCGLVDDGRTWQQYFLEAALSDWHNYQALALEAKEQEYVLDEEYVTMIEELPESLAVDGGLYGYDSAESYLEANVGKGATVSHYQAYMTTYYEGFMYFQDQYEVMAPTDEELDAYFAEHAEEYQAQGITQEGCTVDIRHILVLPEGATVETIYTQTFPEEAWAVGQKNADEILNQWLSGDKTEESFATLANEHSQDPGSNTNGGLYTGVKTGEMVEEFDAWIFDPARKAGDYGIVKTQLGYHVMYFSGSTPIWKGQATKDILNQRGQELLLAAMEKFPLEVDYSAITLGYVDMNA